METVILYQRNVSANDDLTSLLSSMPNTRFIIQYQHTLTSNVTIASNVILDFQGGSIGGNYTLTGSDTVIDAPPVKIFGDGLSLSGTWRSPHYYCEWLDRDVERTIGAFRAVSFVGSYVFSEPICINKLAKIEFCPGSSVQVSNNAALSYLFVVDIDNDEVSVQNVPYIYDGVRFQGYGKIDMNNRCGFALVKKNANNGNLKYNVYFQDLRVINCGKRINDEEALAFVETRMQETIFSNCWFSRGQGVSASCLQEYGILCDAFDCKLTRVTILTYNTGIRMDCGAVLTDVHVWGLPHIAFKIKGDNCKLVSTFADGGYMNYYLESTVHSIEITSFMACSRDSSSDFENRGTCYLIVTEGQDIRGIATGFVSSVHNGELPLLYPVYHLETDSLGSESFHQQACPLLFFADVKEGFHFPAFSTTNRPASNIPAGYSYFDTTLNKPLWWNGQSWVTATGT